MYKTFMIAYDPTSPQINIFQFLEFVRSNAFTYQFYAPHVGLVLIKSTADIYSINDSYRAYLAGEHVFIAEVFSHLTAGSLPRIVWDWINSASPPPLIGPRNVQP